MDKKNRAIFFIIIIVSICIDQLSKLLVIANKESLPKSLLFNLLKFTYCENRGIAFGFASGHARFFSIATLIILVVIVCMLYKNFNKLGKVISIGAAFLVAGGFGNFIDRAVRAYVVDFIDISNIIKFPIFNVADICVVTGVILIGISYFTLKESSTSL